MKKHARRQHTSLPAKTQEKGIKREREGTRKKKERKGGEEEGRATEAVVRCEGLLPLSASPTLAGDEAAERKRKNEAPPCALAWRS